MSAAAQTSWWLDGAYSTARPPAGAPQEGSTHYGLLGVRGETVLQPYTLKTNISGGHALENGGGRWLWFQGEAQHDYGRLGLFLLQYRQSSDYQTMGAHLQPQLRFAHNALTVRPLAAIARWKAGDSSAVLYGVAGGQAQWQQSIRGALLRLSGDAYTTGDNGFASGGYFTLSADAYTVWKRTTVGVGASVADNPLDTEGGYSVWASHQLRENLRFDAVLSQTVTDAMFGTPGALGFTAMLSWRFGHKLPPAAPTLAKVGQAVSRGRVVQFSVQVPGTPRTVAVSGTFSDWRPIALKRGTGGSWMASVIVAPGTHQYGFLIDGGVWYVPEDAADVIDDGFGRKNVTLIVRPK